MKSRLRPGFSDPVSFTCTCSASSSLGGGIVLLFYRYFAAPPSLPDSLAQSIDVQNLSAFHSQVTEKLQLGGKIRVAKEGFNITVGGTSGQIDIYMKECMSHWSFAGLELDTEDKQCQFFKPTIGGCACAFGGPPTSVRVTTEITPMGVTNYLPQQWDVIESLEPAEFHERCWRNDANVLIDVRNHYESRIGYFVNPRTGAEAVRPGIRRFSQWPQYVKSHSKELGNSDEGVPKHLLTYCTGGIRCEKGVRFMADQIERMEGDTISTLKGGIAAYLMWIDDEVRHGRKQPEESLFRGKNYVFDGRGSIGLEKDSTHPVSNCDLCGVPSDRLSKCLSRGCHLIMIVCSTCQSSKEPRCCQNCLEMDMANENDQLDVPAQSRQMCACERAREAELWANKNFTNTKGQGWRKKKRAQESSRINIQIKTID